MPERTPVHQRINPVAGMSAPTVLPLGGGRAGQILKNAWKQGLTGNTRRQHALDVFQNERRRFVVAQQLQIDAVQKMASIQFRLIVGDTGVTATARRGISLTGRPADQHQWSAGSDLRPLDQFPQP